MPGGAAVLTKLSMTSQLMTETAEERSAVYAYAELVSRSVRMQNGFQFICAWLLHVMLGRMQGLAQHVPCACYSVKLISSSATTSTETTVPLLSAAQHLQLLCEIVCNCR